MWPVFSVICTAVNPTPSDHPARPPSTISALPATDSEPNHRTLERISCDDAARVILVDSECDIMRTATLSAPCSSTSVSTSDASLAASSVNSVWPRPYRIPSPTMPPRDTTKFSETVLYSSSP